MQIFNVVSLGASEPETVCYCTQAPRSYLKISSALQISQLNFNQSLAGAVVDQNGCTIQFQMFPKKTNNITELEPLISIQNYIDIILVNNSQSLSLNLYSKTGSIAKQIVFSKYLFRFNIWTNYSIAITTTTTTLTIDGTPVDVQSHSVPLPSSALTVNVSSPHSLSYLLHRI